MSQCCPFFLYFIFELVHLWLHLHAQNNHHMLLLHFAGLQLFFFVTVTTSAFTTLQFHLQLFEPGLHFHFCSHCLGMQIPRLCFYIQYNCFWHVKFFYSSDFVPLGPESLQGFYRINKTATNCTSDYFTTALTFSFQTADEMCVTIVKINEGWILCRTLWRS